jgi:hypothetical protein
MTALCRWIFAMAAALMLAGCSTPDSAPAASGPEASNTSNSATASATPTATSVFCLDLETFQVGIVVFRGDVLRAVRGQPLDFEDLRKRAVYIAHIGKEMQESAPPDIAEQFRAVLKAIRTSASRLKSGAKVRDVVNPLYGDHINPTFDAVNTYRCR